MSSYWDLGFSMGISAGRGGGRIQTSSLHAAWLIHFPLSLFRATQIKTYSWDNAQVILVGNKCDMEEERVVPTEKGRLLAEQLGMCMICVCTCAWKWDKCV
jgi:hypothetical protein